MPHMSLCLVLAKNVSYILGDFADQFSLFCRSLLVRAISQTAWFSLLCMVRAWDYGATEQLSKIHFSLGPRPPSVDHFQYRNTEAIYILDEVMLRQ